METDCGTSTRFRYAASADLKSHWSNSDRNTVPEDILIVIAEALLAGLTATVWKFVMVSYSGYHAENIPEGAVDLVNVAYWRYINNAIYNPILGLVKISFLITLLKLRSFNRLIIASLWALIVVNILFIFAATFGGMFMCRPVHKYWQGDVPGTCGNAPQYIFGVIGVTIATDVLVTIIPVCIIYDLQMPLRDKLGVIVFLSLPLAVTTIGCYRLHAFVVVFSLPTISAEDPYNVRNALSNIESNLAVIAACGPTIKWILARFIPYFDRTHPTNSYTPNLSLQFQPRSRGYRKSNGDIELRNEGFGHLSPCGVRESFWKAKDTDAESEEQCITIHAEHEIRKTTVAAWGSSAAQAPKSVLNTRSC